MFGWLRSKARRSQPEAKWEVLVEAAALTVIDDKGQSRSVAKQMLHSVAIETNDSGPWGMDVWWLLFTEGDTLACAFPQGATGEKVAIDYLMSLEGFENSILIEAMGCTDNAVFRVWHSVR